ncbi:SecY-interacting protein [Motiliproteus coralliicola]|uniref:SecY-interacting protein n=1 Tax=Motiliproteus coralliicola TaxID=2283196 RepID=UPI0026AFB080
MTTPISQQSQPVSASDQNLEQALQRFIDDSLAHWPALPLVEFDPLWPSPCYQEQADNQGQIPWRPVRQQQRSDMFERLEKALEETIHPSIKSYYLSYWSDPLPARSAQGELDLLFAWSEEDLERLRANLIGHAMGRRRLKQPLSLFFGCTKPEEYVLAVDNRTGAVLLEQPGRKTSERIADSLAEFIQQLKPAQFE